MPLIGLRLDSPPNGWTFFFLPCIFYPEVIYMSYRIEYDGRIGKYEVRKKSEWSIPFLITLAFAAIISLSYVLWPEGHAWLQSYLIPGEDAVTIQAFQNLTNDLRSGAAVSEAVYSFCRFVIHGA